MPETTRQLAPLIGFLTRPCVIGAIVGLLVSNVVIHYSYTYAITHDSSIINFIYYLWQKEYRLLQFSVSLLPIGVGYYYGRLREELSESRKGAEQLRRVISINEQLKTERIDKSYLDLKLITREKEVIGLSCCWTKQ